MTPEGLVSLAVMILSPWHPSFPLMGYVILAYCGTYVAKKVLINVSLLKFV